MGQGLGHGSGVQVTSMALTTTLTKPHSSRNTAIKLMTITPSMTRSDKKHLAYALTNGIYVGEGSILLIIYYYWLSEVSFFARANI